MNASLPATITKVTTMRDHTVRLQVDCQQIAPADMAELFLLGETQGWFFFKENPIKEINVKDLPPLEPSLKQTPSQRLRSVLYLLWQQENPKQTFEQFYEIKMTQLISFVKAKLED